MASEKAKHHHPHPQFQLQVKVAVVQIHVAPDSLLHFTAQELSKAPKFHDRNERHECKPQKQEKIKILSQHHTDIDLDICVYKFMYVYKP